MIKRALLCVAMAAVGLTIGTTVSSGASSSGIPAGPIKLGLSAPQSGDQAADGLPISKNIAAAVEYVNAHYGGIAGHKIKLITLNDQSDPTVAVSVARELVSDGVAGIIQPSYPPMEYQEIPVFEKAKIAEVLTSSPGDQYESTKQYPYLFSVYPDNVQSDAPYGPWLKASGITKVGILNDNSLSSQQVTKDAMPGLKKAGIKVVGVATVSFNGTDFTPQVQELENDGAQAVMGMQTIGASHLYDAFRALNWTPKAILQGGNLWFDSPSGAVAHAPINFATTFICLPQNGGFAPQLSSVMAYFIKATGGGFPDVIAGSLPAIDSVLTFKYAIEAAHSLNGAAISSAIEKIHNRAYLGSSANTISFSATNHSGWVHTLMCDLTPLGAYFTPYVSTSLTNREPVTKTTLPPTAGQ